MPDKKELELELEKAKKQKEQADARLLKIEWAIAIFGLIILFSCIFVASFVKLALWLKIVLIVLGLVLFLILALICVWIERVAGYFECAKCHYRHVPTRSQIHLAMHIGRTRYLKCPKCGEKSWNKKVLSDN